MTDATRSTNMVELFGQRFHAVVAILYFGLGLVVADGLARWFPDGSAWRTPIALAIFAAASGWWIVLWRRRQPPGA